jgi:hypothetical protein
VAVVSTPDEALALVAAVCALPGNSHYVEDTERLMQAAGVAAAVERRDTPTLYRWLMHGFSYQGISDRVAAAYIARHGNADWEQLERALADQGSLCPKLQGFESYRGCRYRKAARTCGNPEGLASCPVPALPLRKGSLNEQAVSLFLFLRDRCAGDLVGFIDQLIASAADAPDPVTAQREALLAAFGEVHGVSRKLLSMTLAMLLIGANPGRTQWVAVGRSMVAIDSLVHNLLHRTGILAAYGADHAYGQRCYGERGCEAVLRDLAERFDARTLNPSYPPCFPRLVQYALWRFCAGHEGNVCNGRHIPRGAVCALSWCPVREGCSRVPLPLAAAQEAG